MSRWGIPSMIWSVLAGSSSRDRVSCRIYSSKPYRSTYESSSSAPYRVKSRVSVYDEPSVRRRESFYKHSNESHYPTYGSSKYDNYGSYAGGYAGYSTSSRKSYESTYRASATPPSYPKPYYTPARDAFDYERSHHRQHSSNDKSNKHDRKHSEKKSKSHKSRKSVHWDDDTFNGRQQDWDRRYDRYGGESNYDYRQSHDRYGRPTSGVRDTTPRATASGNTYTYTAAATLSRDGGYYQDESRRRTQKDFEYGYKFWPSRRSMY
ncbi:hypothetical protein Sste5346_001993 [Sporothrix stenoceras]|uniref:Uncharacterized protein n=1 Tax=Sporothrix stenoceras TaxID=5173 RepID=A0ABR3ZL73_9PEZI